MKKAALALVFLWLFVWPFLGMAGIGDSDARLFFASMVYLAAFLLYFMGDARGESRP